MISKIKIAHVSEIVIFFSSLTKLSGLSNYVISAPQNWPTWNDAKRFTFYALRNSVWTLLSIRVNCLIFLISEVGFNNDCLSLFAAEAHQSFIKTVLPLLPCNTRIWRGGGGVQRGKNIRVFNLIGILTPPLPII